MTDASTDRIEINGAPASVEDLRLLVQTNYGHFSAMQVAGGCVRGLGLHLDRIQRATRELFATSIDRERVRDCLRHAIAGSHAPLSARVNIFSRALNRSRPAEPVTTDILVMTAATPTSRSEPLRVKSFAYARDLPAIKHVGTFPLFHYRRLAQQAGFDDAVFVDAGGCISEGSVWNIGFFDGQGVVWPDAAQLSGVSMQLLRAGLARKRISSSVRRVPLDAVGEFRAAFFTNSSDAVRMITCIDTTEFAVDHSLPALLAECYETNAWDPI